ncbi:hypothetical protein C0389_02515 [bacterium]|nr:hypothetical protein [bacterium]
MKIILLIWIIISPSFLRTYNFCQAQSNREKDFYLKEVYVPDNNSGIFFSKKQAAKIADDSSATIDLPKFFTDAHLFLGAEIIDPFHPKESLVTATRLWKTDIRVGISQAFKYGIVSFLSIRANDFPQTNNVNLYEAGIKINHEWGTLWFGQRRIQSGHNSFYLDDAFDRSFWDQGLIYDYLMRGIGTIVNLGIGKTELFLGSDKSSYFIGGGKYSIQPFTGFNAQASGLYIARDQQYSAFGTELGFEFEESFKHFFGYQAIAFKKFEQDPSPLQVLTIFAEGRYLPEGKWNFGATYFFKRLKDLWHNQDELRMSFDIRYKAGEYFTPVFQTELFRNAGYTEVHLGFSAYLQYFKNIRIIPRVRYIITEFGPDIGFIGLEGNFNFGIKE